VSYFDQIARFLSCKDCFFISGGLKEVEIIHKFTETYKLAIRFANLLDAKSVASTKHNLLIIKTLEVRVS
jgi:hypothetical protein